MSKRVLYNITSASLQATNISGGTINAATFTGGNLSLSGDLKVAGTLTTVNITSTNLVNTNVSAGVVVASTLLSATGNSNTIGNIFTTGGNLGVGITSPSRKLHVQSDMRIGGSGAVLDFGDDFTTQIFRNATTSEMRFNTNNLSRMTITSTGNLGIGTTAPASQLDVNGSIVCRSSLSAISTSGNVAAFFASDNSVLGWSFGLDTDTSFKIKGGRAGGNQFTNSTFGTTRFTINTGGNVGIACTAPTHLFSVGIAPNGTTKGSISINTSDESRYHLFNYAGVAEWLFGQKSTSRSDFTFSKLVAGTETDYLTISTGGNVGIGTTAPAYTLDVNGTIRASTSLTTGFVSPNLLVNNATGNGSTVLALMTPNLTTGGNMAAMFFGQTSGNGNMGQLNFGYYGNNNTQNNMSLTFFGGGGTQMYLSNNGNIGINNSSPSTTLDVSGTIRASTSITTGALYSTNLTSTNIVATNLSAGSLGFSNISVTSATIGTSLLAIGNSNTVGAIITTGGNVGIGTASPNNKLHVVGSTSNLGGTIAEFRNPSNAESLQIIDETLSTSLPGGILNATGSYGIGVYARSGPVRFFTTAGNLERMRITESGNVGIGTTSPGSILHVAGPAGSMPFIPSGNGVHMGIDINSNSGIQLNSGTNGSVNYEYIDFGYSGVETVGRIIHNNSNRSLLFQVNSGTNAMQLNSTGSVSIPGGLDVAGNGRFTGPGGVGTNGSVLITGQDAYGHSLIVAGAASQKRLVFGHTGTVGNIFAYDYAAGSQNLCFQLPGGNVGIGTSIPGSTLHVNGGGIFASNNTITHQGLHLQWNRSNGGGESWIINQLGLAMSETASIRFGKSNASNVVTEQMRITESGNVGINTTSPAYTLDVNGTARINTTRGVLIGSSTDIDTGRLISALDSGMAGNNAERYITFGRAASANNQSELSFCNVTTGSTSNYLGLGLFGSRTMAINGAGNVGIGTTSPSRKLHVQGAMRLGGSGAALDFGDDFTTQIYRNATTSEMRFNTNSVERMTITSSGNVGIGTLSPVVPLQVASSTTVNVAGGYFFGTATSSLMSYTTSNQPISIFANSAILTQTNFLASSDIRIKNLSDETINLNHIDNINPEIYTYKDSIRNPRKNIGFIAQNVFEHCPEAVSIHQGVIPDIMKVVDILEKNETLITVKNDYNLKEKDIIKIMVDEDDLSGVYTTVIYADEDIIKFKVTSDERLKETIFIYGRQVDDFHELNYDYIFTLGFAGIKESRKDIILLKEQLQAEKTLTQQQATTIQNLETRVVSLEARLTAAGL